MAGLNPDKPGQYPDNYFLSGDTLPGQTRTPPYKGVQLSGVRTVENRQLTKRSGEIKSAPPPRPPKFVVDYEIRSWLQICPWCFVHPRQNPARVSWPAAGGEPKRIFPVLARSPEQPSAGFAGFVDLLGAFVTYPYKHPLNGLARFGERDHV
jgi:hypothetical protein